MQAEFWHTRWKDKELGFNQSQPNPLMKKYFPTLKLKSNARVFVPLCGKSIDMLWLAQQGYRVIGVELSEIACTDFFKENELEHSVTLLETFSVFKSELITLLVGDFFNLTRTLVGDIDAVYDRAGLIALPLEMRHNYSSFLAKLLNDKSQMLLLTTVYNQSEMQGPPFSVNAQEVKKCYGKELSIKEIYHKEFSDIPKHLKAKGLLSAVEHVFHLS